MKINLAFYYHITIVKKDGELFCPGFLGVFLDSLAKIVNKLTLVMHESSHEIGSDYRLKQSNINFISLGKKTAAWHRMIMHRTILKKKLSIINDQCDVILVRAPSPLAPYFNRYLQNIKLVYLVVGDYGEGGKLIKISSVRNLFVKLFLVFNNHIFQNEMKKNQTIVNSILLFDKYKSSLSNINLVKTTTLSKNDFFERVDTCQGKKINILYTGRLAWEKGLRELIQAFGRINSYKNNIYLNFVGWEDDIDKTVEKELKEFSRTLNIENNVIFHGFKNVGDELNEMYRMADLYVIPSYHEGFPRTIWEAMANSLPVICTSVGSIPKELTNGHDAIIIKPKKPNQIEEAIVSLIDNTELRKSIILNGRMKASHNTLETQSKKLIELIIKNK